MKAIRFLSTAAGLALITATAACAESASKPTFNAPADVAAIKEVEEILATEIDIDKVLPHYADDA
ncbi:MAG: hypothetical protein V4521_01840, partial [Pseudomonadota bacterium]